mmetsp:Transcript_90366/g.235235  ORF Transcript_90366/g.235235 Transcript_90366/m.235235 type:complete len:345 (+) Transcript_90366:515-1549(+)
MFSLLLMVHLFKPRSEDGGQKTGVCAGAHLCENTLLTLLALGLERLQPGLRGLDLVVQLLVPLAIRGELEPLLEDHVRQSTITLAGDFGHRLLRVGFLGALHCLEPSLGRLDLRSHRLLFLLIRRTLDPLVEHFLQHPFRIACELFPHDALHAILLLHLELQELRLGILDLAPPLIVDVLFALVLGVVCRPGRPRDLHDHLSVARVHAQDDVGGFRVLLTSEHRQLLLDVIKLLLGVACLVRSTLKASLPDLHGLLPAILRVLDLLDVGTSNNDGVLEDCLGDSSVPVFHCLFEILACTILDSTPHSRYDGHRELQLQKKTLQILGKGIGHQLRYRHAHLLVVL